MDFCFDCAPSEYLLTSGLLFYVLIYAFLWFSWGRHLNKMRRFYLVLLVAFVAVTLDLTLFPMLSTTPSRGVFNPNFEFFRFIVEIYTYRSWQVLKLTVLNVLLFVPLGYFGRKAFPNKLWHSLALVVFLSLFIEGSQGLLSWSGHSYRIFDVDDLVVNVFGGLVGLVLTFIPVRMKEKRFEIPPNVEFFLGLILMVVMCFIGIHIIY